MVLKLSITEVMAKEAEVRKLVVEKYGSVLNACDVDAQAREILTAALINAYLAGLNDGLHEATTIMV